MKINIKKLLITLCLMSLITTLYLSNFLPRVYGSMITNKTVENSYSRIIINQIGYYPNSVKLGFLVNGIDPENPVELINAKTKKTVLIPKLRSSYQDKDSKDIIQNITFTTVKDNGTYYLQYGSVKSYPFKISNNVYQEPWKQLLRSYYLQRCGVAINDKFTGVQHPARHLNDGLIAHEDEIHPQGKLIKSISCFQKCPHCVPLNPADTLHE